MKGILAMVAAVLLLVGQSVEAQEIFYAATTPGHDSKGIYVLKFDRKTATFTVLQTVTDKRNPNFLAVDPSRNYLYVICGEGVEPGDKRGSVLSFSIDAHT